MPKRKKARATALDADKAERSRRFISAREAKGLGQEDVSAALGISLSTVWRWEKRGTVTDADALVKVARLYGRSPEWLMTGTEGFVEAPDYPALHEFMAGDYPERKMLEPWMEEKLRAERFPDDIEPTVETYRRLVSSYASVRPETR